MNNINEVSRLNKLLKRADATCNSAQHLNNLCPVKSPFLIQILNEIKNVTQAAELTVNDEFSHSDFKHFNNELVLCITTLEYLIPHIKKSAVIPTPKNDAAIISVDCLQANSTIF